jgi:hypothetical protein
MLAATRRKFNACNYFGIESLRLILDCSQIDVDRSCGVGLVPTGNGLERTSMGLATAILTKRNSVVISIAQKAEKCQNSY